MDMLHTGLLIRGLIVLAMLCFMVIAGALLAGRERRRASDSASDTSGFPVAGPAAMEIGVRDRAHCGRLEANDSEASEPRVQRRAA